ALSMGAGEYVSVRSQRELLEASTPDPHAAAVLPHLDVDANELALVYRARGMAAAQAEAHAREVLAGYRTWTGRPADAGVRGAAGGDEGVRPVIGDGADGDRADGGADEHETIGTAWRAAVSSFCFFASGAIIPVLPYLFGATGFTGQIIA